MLLLSREMVQNSDWGPSLWKILHISAEKVGRQPTGMLSTDELRAWQQLLRVTEGIMPCALCRKHYGEWRKAHSIEGLAAWRGEQLRSESRKWLWELHDAVNRRKAIESGGEEQKQVKLEDAKEMYEKGSREDLTKEYDALHKVIQNAIAQGLIAGAYWREWVARFRFLRSIWGV